MACLYISVLRLCLWKAVKCGSRCSVFAQHLCQCCGDHTLEGGPRENDESRGAGWTRRLSYEYWIGGYPWQGSVDIGPFDPF